jgi:hypothetical protein
VITGGSHHGAVSRRLCPADILLKVIGLGMATAILVDATVVRMLLMPAVMHLLGRANWWLPKSVQSRLPQLSVEGHPEQYLPAPEDPLPGEPDHDRSAHRPQSAELRCGIMVVQNATQATTIPQSRALAAITGCRPPAGVGRASADSPTAHSLPRPRLAPRPRPCCLLGKVTQTKPHTYKAVWRAGT